MTCTFCSQTSLETHVSVTEMQRRRKEKDDAQPKVVESLRKGPLSCYVPLLGAKRLNIRCIDVVVGGRRDWSSQWEVDITRA